MGLIRKSLNVATVGVARGSSKKQRVAKATERNTLATALAAERSAKLLDEAKRAAELTATREHEFRYDTDAAYRTWFDAKREAELAEAAEIALRQQQAAAARAQAKAAKRDKRLPGSLPMQAGAPDRFAFNPPPNWPPAPEGWKPEPGWQPDVAWGTPPADWLVWLELPEPRAAPAAWYDDASDATRLRYWDGEAWTEQTRVK